MFLPQRRCSAYRGMLDRAPMSSTRHSYPRTTKAPEASMQGVFARPNRCDRLRSSHSQSLSEQHLAPRAKKKVTNRTHL